MEGRFKYEKLAKYPHMSPADTIIWERFIVKFPDFFQSVDYDIHVGEGCDHLPTGEQTAEGRENRLYQKKIDVIGYKNNQAWIIEVKPRAGITAMGQLICYSHLATAGILKGRNLVKAVIAEVLDNDVKAIYYKNEIKIFIL